jgi:hypothetical protein
MTAEFQVFAGNDESLDLAHSASIKYRRKVMTKGESDKGHQAFLYMVDVPGYKPTEMAFIPGQQPEKEWPSRLPGWARKEVRRDKRAWREIHQTLRHTPKWAPEYFEAIPEVDPAVPVAPSS